MYLKHFELRQKPFENTTDPRFFWFNETFTEAHAALEYGLQEKKGFMLLTGNTGSGKTALIHAFLETVAPETSVAVIPDADLEPVDFFNYLSMELGLQRTFQNKGEFLIFFKRYLRETILPAGGQVLIIIDEAQRSSNKLLTDIRLFDSLGTDNQTAVTILLSGQIDLVDLLAGPENGSLKSRVALNIRIEPLTEIDTDKYIRHRLDKAGARDRVFDAGAVEAIYKSTGGNPLQINNLCDRALLTAYTSNTHRIGPEVINECAVELGIALDSNTEIGDDEIQLAKPDEDPEDLKIGGRPETDDAPPHRPIKFFVIALVGVALAILLQMSIFQMAGFDRAADQDQALSTFKSYQQRFETAEESEVSSF